MRTRRSERFLGSLRILSYSASGIVKKMQHSPTEKIKNTVAAAAASHFVKEIVDSPLGGLFDAGESSSAPPSALSSSRGPAAILNCAMETRDRTGRQNQVGDEGSIARAATASWTEARARSHH